MKTLKTSFLSLMIASCLIIPVLTFAHGGVDDGDEETGVTNSVIHEVEAEGFSLATPWSSKWWMLVGTSLILMGLLSISVDKYLRVE